LVDGGPWQFLVLLLLRWYISLPPCRDIIELSLPHSTDLNASLVPLFRLLNVSDTDSYARITTEPKKDKSRGTNGVLDLPAGLVCEILYDQPEQVEENGSI